MTSNDLDFSFSYHEGHTGGRGGGEGIIQVGTYIISHSKTDVGKNLIKDILVALNFYENFGFSNTISAA